MTPTGGRSNGPDASKEEDGKKDQADGSMTNIPIRERMGKGRGSAMNAGDGIMGEVVTTGQKRKERGEVAECIEVR